MSSECWDSFRQELTSLITTLGGTLWVDSSGIGSWDGGPEDNHVVIAGLPHSQVDNLRVSVISLGMKYRQEDIAVLAGTSELIACSANQALLAPVSL